MPAFDFELGVAFVLMFWSWLHPNLQSNTARFARPQLLIIATNQNQPCKITNRPGNTTAQKKQTKWNYHHFYLLQKPPTEITIQLNNPPIWIFINPETSEPGFRVLTFGVSYNAGVKRPASAGPLERLVMRALAFDTEPLFWPFLHRTSRTSLPSLHNANYLFLQITRISFCKIKNPPGNTTTRMKQTKWSYHHLLPASKTTYLNYHHKEEPKKPNFTNPGIIQSGFHLWVLNFSVLHNAGVKRAASAAPLERLVMLPNTR